MERDDMERVLDAELEYPGDGLYYHAGKPFTGIVYTLNEEEGWVAMETEYVAGLPSGSSREWADSEHEHLVYEAQFRGGVVHGRQRRWSDDGILIEEGEYEYGIPLSEKKWDEEGDLVDNYTLKESDANYALLMKYRQIERDQTDQRKSSN